MGHHGSRLADRSTDDGAVEECEDGEHGNGFAVVGTEVRALAHFASDAAREICTLFGSPLDQVDNGSVRVRSVEQVIAAIVTSVRHVSALVRTITKATVDQPAGISSINRSIAEVDEASQQIASLSQ